MTVSGTLYYVWTCTYYACRTAFLFTVELLLFLPSYYLVERHDTPSAWLGQRGEAQVQPVLPTAHQYEKAADEEQALSSGHGGIVTVSERFGQFVTDRSTQEVEERRCVLLRKAVCRIRSLHTTKGPANGWGAPPPPPSPLTSLSGLHASGTPQLPRQQTLVPRGQSHASPRLPKPGGGGGGSSSNNTSGGGGGGGEEEETLYGSEASWTHDSAVTTYATARSGGLAAAAAEADTRGHSSHCAGSDPAPVSLENSPLIGVRDPRARGRTRPHPNGGEEEEDAEGGEIMDGAPLRPSGPPHSAAASVVDSASPTPSITDTLFDGVVVSVTVAMPLSPVGGGGSDPPPGEGGTPTVAAMGDSRGLVARWTGGSSCKPAAEVAAAAARVRLLASVPTWCAIDFRAPVSSAAKRVRRGDASSTVQGQYGFLPPWYAVHARAQLLLALADPLLRIAVELLCFRGWATPVSTSATNVAHPIPAPPAEDVAAALDSAAADQERRATQPPPPPPWASFSVLAAVTPPHVFRRGTELVFQVPLHLFRRVTRALWPAARVPLSPSDATVALSSPQRRGFSFMRPLEEGVRARLDQYTADTSHAFDELHTHTDGGAASLLTTASVASVSRSRSPGVADGVGGQSRPLPFPLAPDPSIASNSAASYGSSVGVYWLHGRRPPACSKAPLSWGSPDTAAATSRLHPSRSPPAPVVVLLLCPSLLQGSGLFTHALMRISHICQLLTLAGEWQSNGGASETSDEPTAFSSVRASSHAPGKSRTSPAVGPNGSQPANPTEVRSRGGREDVRAEAAAPLRDTPSVWPLPRSPHASASHSSAVQWYAAMPAVERRVATSAASPGLPDDVSMLPLTLKDLRLIVERLRQELESPSTVPSKAADRGSKTGTAHRATPNALYSLLRRSSITHEAALPQPSKAAKPPAATPQPQRRVRIVAVGWSEAASPLLELAITQPQLASRGALGRGYLDGVVCLSHTLSSSFQLLPQQYTDPIAREAPQLFSPSVLSSAATSHGDLFPTTHNNNSSSGGGATDTGNKSGTCAVPHRTEGMRSLWGPPHLAALTPSIKLHAVPRIPRILSHLTTGPARLLLLLTRMHLIADALLAQRQNKAAYRQSFPVAIEDTPADPRLATRHSSLYHLLQHFREAREEVNRAQHGMDRVTVRWTQQVQQQHSRSPFSTKGPDGVPQRLYQGSGAAATAPQTAGCREEDTPRNAVRTGASLPSQQQVSVTLSHQPRPSPSPVQGKPLSSPAAAEIHALTRSRSTGAHVGFAASTDTVTTHALQPSPLWGKERADATITEGRRWSQEGRDAVAAAKSAGKGTTPAMPCNSEEGTARARLPLLSSVSLRGQGNVQNSRELTPHTHRTSPLLAQQDSFHDPFTLWDLPRLETATDWEELAQAATMTETPQQPPPQAEASSLPASDRQPPLLLQPCSALGDGAAQTISRSAAATLRSSSSGEYPGTLGGGRHSFFSVPRTKVYLSGNESAEPGALMAGGTTEKAAGNGGGYAALCRSLCHLSTDDVIAACTLQVMSPKGLQVVSTPGAPMPEQSPDNGSKGGTSPSFTSEPPPSEDFRSLDSPTVSPRITPSRSEVMMMAPPVLPHGVARVVVPPLQQQRTGMDPSSLPCNSALTGDARREHLRLPSTAYRAGSSSSFLSMPTTTTTTADGHQTELPSHVSSTTSTTSRHLRTASPLVAPPSLASTQRSPPHPTASLRMMQPSSRAAAALVELRVRSAQHAALIQRIRVPTMLVHSRDDPVAPTSTVPFSLLQANPWITTVLTRRGSHAIFMEGVSEVWRRPRLVVTEDVKASPDPAWRFSSFAKRREVSWTMDNTEVLGGGGGLEGAATSSFASLRSSVLRYRGPTPRAATLPAATLSQCMPLTVAELADHPRTPHEPTLERDAASDISTTTTDGEVWESRGGREVDDGPSGLVEWLPVSEGPQDGGERWNARQRQQPPRRGDFDVGSASPRPTTTQTHWKVSIEGTTWLERLLFEYVEKAVLNPSSASSTAFP